MPGTWKAEKQSRFCQENQDVRNAHEYVCPLAQLSYIELERTRTPEERSMEQMRKYTWDHIQEKVREGWAEALIGGQLLACGGEVVWYGKWGGNGRVAGGQAIPLGPLCFCPAPEKALCAC